jgi:imidazolonepropionase-like amidohydrolase
LFSGKIHAGWLIDGTGGPARENMMLDVREGLICAVAPASLSERSETEFLDCAGATLLPGLIDSHVHLCLPQGAALAQPNPMSKDPGTEWDAVITGHLRQAFSHGIVAVRDGGDRFEMVWRYKKAHADGEVPKVAIHTPGSAFFKKGRYGGFIGKAIAEGEALADAVIDHAPRFDHIKILNSGLNSLTQFGRETPSQFTLPQLRQAVSMAARFHRAVMVHANGRVPVGEAIEAGCRSIEHGYFMGKENLLKMRDKGIIWVPTAIPMKAHERRLVSGSVEADVVRRTLAHQLEQMAFARQVGVMVAAGSDAGSPGVAHGSGLIEELKLLRLAGYSLEEAICCATANGSRLIAPDVSGIIQTGASISLVVVPGAPDALLENLARARPIDTAYYCNNR